MSKLTPMTRMLFVDIETTGLDTRTELMLEFGMVLYDMDFVPQDLLSFTLWDSGVESKVKTIKRLASMHREGEIVAENSVLIDDMHTKSGLFANAEAGGLTRSKANDTILEFIESNGLGREDPVCGSSVHFDRKFMDKYFYDVNEMLSYRNIDISSIGEAARRFSPGIYKSIHAELNPKRLHRVLPDINDSMEQLKAYRGDIIRSTMYDEDRP